MTIKETFQGDTAEPDVVVYNDGAQTNTGDNEPEIPMVMATLVTGNNVAPSHGVDTNIISPGAQYSGSQYSSNTPAYPPTTVVSTQQLHPQVMGQGTAIPEGAQWVTVRHIGVATWSLCAIISTCTCMFMLCPCGLWAFACPCDEIRGYEVNGLVYDEFGRPLGSISELKVIRRG